VAGSRPSPRPAASRAPRAPGWGRGSRSTPAVRPAGAGGQPPPLVPGGGEGLAPMSSTVRRGHGDNDAAPAGRGRHERRGCDPRGGWGRRPAYGGPSHHRAGLGQGRQGVVRGPQPRHAGGGAPIQRRGLQGRRTAAVRGGRPRQLEGQAHRGQPAGRRDRAGAPGGILSLVAPIPPATVLEPGRVLGCYLACSWTQPSTPRRRRAKQGLQASSHLGNTPLARRFDHADPAARRLDRACQAWPESAPPVRPLRK
jgi:hypothetical protein